MRFFEFLDIEKLPSESANILSLFPGLGFCTLAKRSVLCHAISVRLSPRPPDYKSIITRKRLQRFQPNLVTILSVTYPFCSKNLVLVELLIIS